MTRRVVLGFAESAIAYGLHLKSLTYARRGNKFVNETSEQQLDEFARTMNQAAQLLAADVPQRGCTSWPCKA